MHFVKLSYCAAHSHLLIRFPDYLEVAIAVVVSVWSWYNFSLCIDILLIFFHILVLHLNESRIPLKPELRGRENCCNFH